ncbi:hypothetical protein, partial [Clostridium perfringens]
GAAFFVTGTPVMLRYCFALTPAGRFCGLAFYKSLSALQTKASRIAWIQCSSKKALPEPVGILI